MVISVSKNKNINNHFMIKKSSTYLTPECTIIDIRQEGILCSSQGSDNNGFTIDDYEKVEGSWS